MPLVIDIDQGLLKVALEKELASQKRLFNTTKQPQFKPIIEKDINAYMAGLASIAEVKTK